uniref:protein XNDC1N n=1 Tax=Agelaius phoeniceus TaxID=39638 RepID=UPI0023ECB1BD|nr:protein XNDC1N [Agelaius phoeniceus]
MAPVTREFHASPHVQNKLELEGRLFREGLVHDAVSLLCVQDPKYPKAENLLSEDSIQPWLGCPKDHSRQLSVELVEVNKFLGDEEHHPTVMSWSQSPTGEPSQSHSIMNADISWPELSVFSRVPVSNSVQLTCSQLFSPCSCFGLSFICLHKPRGQEPDPPQPPWTQ